MTAISTVVTPALAIAWTETAPRLGRTGGGARRTVAWVIKEEQRGGAFVLQVTHSDGAAAYPVGTTLHRQVRMLQRHGLRRQGRVAERETAPREAEQLTFGF